MTALAGKSPGHRLGHLVVAGGGPTAPEIVDKALAVSGGKEARVLIIPQASGKSDAGQRSLRMWQRAGAREVAILNLTDRDAALAAVREADLIWFPGGSQSRLIGILNEQGLAQGIRDRFGQGTTVGGTSAGAAVLSQIMLTARARPDRLSPWADGESAGLGLWTDVIVDQHYIRRSRFNRLLAAVLDHPD
jgi:cyanophycinase